MIKSQYYNGKKIEPIGKDIYGTKEIVTSEMVKKFLEGLRDGYNEKKDSISLSGAWEGIVDLFKTIKDSSSEKLKQLIIESIEASIRELDSKVDDFEEYVIKGRDEKKAAYYAGRSLLDALSTIQENSNAVSKLGRMGTIAIGIVDGNKKRSNGKDGNSKGRNHSYGTYEDAPYHGNTSNSVKSKAPTNGQEALDNSLSLGENTDRRISVNNGEFVVLDKTSEGLYHGHVRMWGELSQQMQSVLRKAGLVTKKGKIID